MEIWFAHSKLSTNLNSNMFGTNILRFQNMQFFTSSDPVEGGFESVCTRMCLLDFEILTFSTLFCSHLPLIIPIPDKNKCSLKLVIFYDT